MTRRTASSWQASMGLDLASLIAEMNSLVSPYKNRYEFPLKPCSLKHLSICLGLNQNKFSAFHANVRKVTKAKERTIELAVTSI
ncbi:hypothetical protein RHMOL_Rhmol06G0259900 [Rhododendron molle]|uniref:Uncharacterized protein n=1 Tax=Rhododendron molle TaxID=49168 RepID=A0ACC0NHL2_RHOML|nr:hypothetical protein RHMOL_Rhmol06G0259900 [Rhododendron molle]